MVVSLSTHKEKTKTMRRKEGVIDWGDKQGGQTSFQR